MEENRACRLTLCACARVCEWKMILSLTTDLHAKWFIFRRGSFSACLKYSRSLEIVKLYLVNSFVAFFWHGEEISPIFRCIFGRWTNSFLNRISAQMDAGVVKVLMRSIKGICFCSSLFSRCKGQIESRSGLDGNNNKKAATNWNGFPTRAMCAFCVFNRIGCRQAPACIYIYIT